MARRSRWALALCLRWAQADAPRSRVMLGWALGPEWGAGEILVSEADLWMLSCSSPAPTPHRRQNSFEDHWGWGWLWPYQDRKKIQMKGDRVFPSKRQLSPQSPGSAHPQRWCRGGAYLCSHALHCLIHHCVRRCRLSHLVRCCVRLWLRGDPQLCRFSWRWLVGRGGLWRSVCGGLRLMLHAAGWCLAGLWVWSGGLVKSLSARPIYECWVAAHQHPLHIGGKIPSRTIEVEADFVESTKAVIWVMREIGKVEKVPCMVLKGAFPLLQ